MAKSPHVLMWFFALACTRETEHCWNTVPKFLTSSFVFILAGCKTNYADVEIQATPAAPRLKRVLFGPNVTVPRVKL